MSEPVVPPVPAPPASTTSVRAVLLDADGALQLVTTPWRQALTEGGGRQLSEALAREETDALQDQEAAPTVPVASVSAPPQGGARTPRRLIPEALWDPRRRRQTRP
ncbi:hypothetical protein [Actinomyces faecalis]|uniref:hypothetical protein n=1 Tax=Actinomyces faecalis TaxID=2722820 RepID=UPI001553814E